MGGVAMTLYETLGARLSTLPTEDGWINGDGMATTPQAKFTLQMAANALISAGILTAVHVYPRPCGGCQAEWDHRGIGFELRVLSAGDICELDVYDQRGTSRGNARFEEECLAFDPLDAEALRVAVEKVKEIVMVYG